MIIEVIRLARPKTDGKTASARASVFSSFHSYRVLSVRRRTTEEHVRVKRNSNDGIVTKRWLTGAVAAVVLCGWATGANVLAVKPLPAMSHWTFMRAVLLEMAAVSHNLTVYIPFARSSGESHAISTQRYRYSWTCRWTCT